MPPDPKEIRPEPSSKKSVLNWMQPELDIWVEPFHNVESVLRRGIIQKILHPKYTPIFPAFRKESAGRIETIEFIRRANDEHVSVWLNTDMQKSELVPTPLR